MAEHDATSEPKDARTQTEPVSEDFDREVPGVQPSPTDPEDWPEGDVVPADEVGPAIGQRVADVHADRPWLLPGIALGAVVAIVSVLVLRRAR
ncbi:MULTISPECIES: hypothetical protein [unclassified Agrococcus]|uniref:hypothetical protein n=1 Tax=unclassified Agrococcus TaxID=2615065 RepID=UPI003619CD66